MRIAERCFEIAERLDKYGISFRKDETGELQRAARHRRGGDVDA
jgi:hypothetical protein